MLFKNHDLVITDNKNNILKYLSDNNLILNIKIMTLKEFKDNYFGYLDSEALYYLVKKYNYKYDVAKMYMDNFLFLDDLYKKLDEKKLIRKNIFFKDSFKRVILINQYPDLYIKKELDKYEVVTLNDEVKDINKDIYEFDTIEEEVEFVANEISKLLKNISINDINLVNVTSEYELIIKRIFSFYNIPVNLNDKKSLYGYKEVKDFIKNLEGNKNILESLELIHDNTLLSLVVEICNKYAFVDTNDTVIYLIKEEIKNKKVEDIKLENAVNCTDINSIDNKYYFILGFNQNEIPKIYKDEDLISDKRKKELGILTSVDKNIISKNIVKSKLSNYKNIILTYKLSTFKDQYHKSFLVDELRLNVIRPKLNDYTHSILFNKIKLSIMLDNLIKYNKKDPDLDLLYNNTSINYLTYDNGYKKIDKNLLKDYLNNNLLLSYSSIDNYYRCSFKYYLANILKLSKNEDDFNIYIGNLFHYILSKAFLDGFDFEYEFNNFIKDKTFSKKDKFFINKLKIDLIKIIDIIKKQDLDTLLNDAMYEQKIYIDKSRDFKITFMGVIDKIKYKNDTDTIACIIDYKTGEKKADLNNLIYGIDMQLPIYIYLIKNSKLKNVKVAGFYFQNIIHSKQPYNPKSDYKLECEKLYKLDGFTNSNTNYLNKLDKNYINSNMIKSLKLTEKGFYVYSKVLDEEKIDNIERIVSKKIDDAITNILDCNFSINPKRIGTDLKGCEYCKFKDICYVKEENIINLKEQNYKEFLGGDINA